MPGYVWALVALVVSLVVARAARGKWDLVLAHGRDGVRHLLASVLMLGTLAGTVWTMSAGGLSLSGAMERIVSVGGVAAALECGAIYTGWYIGQLDLRIMTARKKEMAQQYRAYQKSLYRWFYAVVGISAVANLIFRAQQLNNLPLAAFVATAPIILIILFTIKLRPLPVDYAEVGRQATQRSLVGLVQQSARAMEHHMRRMGKGHELTPAEVQQLQFAAALVRVYAPTDEQHALDHAIAQGTGATVVEATSERYLSTSDLVAEYGISRRTAQDWIATCPGRRKAARGRAWEVPASALYAAHGVPSQSLPASTSGLLLGAGASARAQTSAKRRTTSAGRRDTSADERDTSADGDAGSADERIIDAVPMGAQVV